MPRMLTPDRVLFTSAIAAVAFGPVMVYSATSLPAADAIRQPSLALAKQLVFVVAGIVGLDLAMNIDYRLYGRPRFVWTLIAVSTAALAAVLAVGPAINGARRWFAVGGFGIQPSEVAKFGVIVYWAAVLAKRSARIRTPVAALLGPAATILPVLGLILLQPDFGTVVLIVGTIGAMTLSAGLRFRHLAATAVCGLPLAGLAVAAEPYRVRRLLAFLDPGSDPLDSGFQVIQSIIAVGSGGVTGRGLGAGVQKLLYLPEAHTDFIYAVVAEELGLLGATAVLAAFVVMAWRGLRAAAHAPDRFGTFLAVGLTVMLTVQALANISVVLGLLPTKGIALPFISAGGSALMMNLVAMGVLLNVSQQARVAPAWADLSVAIEADAADDVSADGRARSFANHEELNP